MQKNDKSFKRLNLFQKALCQTPLNGQGNRMLLADEDIKRFLGGCVGGSKGPDQLRQGCDFPACHQSSLTGLAQGVTWSSLE